MRRQADKMAKCFAVISVLIVPYLKTLDYTEKGDTCALNKLRDRMCKKRVVLNGLFVQVHSNGYW